MRSALFAMVSTRDSAAYTEHALNSFNRNTSLFPSDRLILIDNDNHLNASSVNNAGWELSTNQSPKSYALNANAMLEICLKEERDLYFLNNDVIFSKNWLTPLRELEGDSIVTPLSNREVPYVSSVTSVNTTTIIRSFSLIPPPMYLENFLGREEEYEQICKAHCESYSGFLKMMVMPFFVVKIPYQALIKVGMFDEEFGEGGGEDFDYALRANLLDIPVGYVLGSYLLHFGGKSTWEGEEEQKRQEARQAKYREVFKNKWGEKLFDLILNENSSILEGQSQTESVKEKIFNLLEKEAPNLKI